MGYFITLNPYNSERQQLQENLKILLRSVIMMEPNKESIIRSKIIFL